MLQRPSSYRNSGPESYEHQMILRYWQQVGGWLSLEYPIVRRGPNHGARWVDGLLILHKPSRRVHWRDLTFDLFDEICAIQAKRGRLSLSLMGQTLFAQQLLLRQGRARRVLGVALCEADDGILRPLLEAYSDIQVVVLPPEAPSK